MIDIPWIIQMLVYDHKGIHISCAIIRLVCHFPFFLHKQYSDQFYSQIIAQILIFYPFFPKFIKIKTNLKILSLGSHWLSY